MKHAKFTRITDNKVFEVELDDELWDLFRETAEYVDKMKAVVEAVKRCRPYCYEECSSFIYEDSECDCGATAIDKALEELEKC